jgi:nicotinamidase/pyrazinamidase
VEVNHLRAALLVVDVQRDFCPGGALAVKDGDGVVTGLNTMIKTFERLGLPTMFTRDWHPPDHISFKAQGGIWPPHCVQGTRGAQFHPRLKIPANAVVISKGQDSSKEAYSGFQGTDLEARLRKAGVDKVFIGGLAADYCVKQTTLDGRRAGFEVEVLEDCVMAVDAKRGDGRRALAEMKKAGARMTTTSAAVNELVGAQH